jgi:TPR repeat protein
VQQDYVQAAQWYRRAAQQGLAVAQHNLGRLYTNGQGVPRDFGQAYLWLHLAAAGYPRGKEHDETAALRDFVAKELTPAQRARVQELARQWQPQKEQ